MTDCNACIYGGEPDGYCTVFDRRIIKKSRKEFKCWECGKTVPAGSMYEYTFCVYEGDADASKVCCICAEIRDAYYCDGGAIIGQLWSDVADSDFFKQFNTACLDKLKTPEAKAEMVRRWQKWKGL